MIDQHQSPTGRRWIGRTCRAGVVAATLSVLCVDVTAQSAFAEDDDAASVIYSETYLRLIRAFPLGWVSNPCHIAVFFSGGGVCTTEIDPVYFYPDGSIGKMAWFVDPSSPTGWSIEPDPCDGLTTDEAALWATYVDFTNGYLEAGPALTDEQVDRFGACWGWWF